MANYVIRDQSGQIIGWGDAGELNFSGGYQDGFSWEPYVPQEDAHRQGILTKLDYMNRFTDAELAAIYTAAKSSVAIEVWLEKFKLATEINLDDPRTIDGVNALEAAGLLAPGRAAEILA